MQSQACVLCVDGLGGPSPDFANILEQADEPFEVVRASGREGALDRLESAEVDCVVSGRLADGDALAFLATVRERFPDLPTVHVVDGRGDVAVPTAASAALDNGATEYVVATHVVESPDLLVRRVTTAVERRRRERRLAALHDTTRRLIESSDVDETLAIGLEAAAGVLGLELAAFFRPAEDREALVPAAVTDGVHELLDEVPTIARGEGLVWRAFESGDPIFAEDVGSRPDALNPETPIASEMLIPAGDHGVFVASSTDPAGFDATDEELAGVLVSNLSRAIDSVQREDRLRRRERELEQYETLVRTFPDEVYSLDAEGRFTSIVPPTGSELTTSGYEPDELIGEHVSLVMDDADIETGEGLIVELIESDDRDRASFEMEIVTRSGERIAHENHVALLPPEDDGSFRGTVGVLRNITDRKARERELERQNERLEAFAHIASHDLRNPLNLAAGRLELARDDCDSPHLDHVEEALERMGTLIDDTLTMATEGQSVSTVTTIDLPDLARRSWDAVPGDDATLLVADDLAIRGDPDRLARVLENLFRNAVEHGGPEVSVRVGPLEDGFYVADDGPGVPEGERSAVFEVGHSTAEGGTGFGLAIVREIVEAHGWEIGITDAEAAGTRFEITGVDRV